MSRKWIVGVVCLALWIAPAAAKPRWGVELSSRWSGFADTPVSTVTPSGEGASDESGASLGAGVLAEARAGGRWGYGLAFRYEEPTAASMHPTGLEFFNGGQGYDQWADDRLRFQQLTLAPVGSLVLPRGFRLSVSPELSYLLKATVTRDLSLVPLGSPQQIPHPNLQEPAFAPPIAGHSETDETARFHRWLTGISGSLAYERAIGGQPVRVETAYQVMLNEPSRDDAMNVRMHAFRLSLTWLH